MRARFDVSQVNVVVSNTINFPEYESIERFNKGRTGEDRKWVVTVSVEQQVEVEEGGGREGVRRR